MASFAKWRSGIILAIFATCCLTIVCLNAETVTGYFGKKNQDVCQGDYCKEAVKDGHAPSADSGGEGHVVASQASIAGRGPDPPRPDTGREAVPADRPPREHGGPHKDNTDDVTVIITFTNAQNNMGLQKKFRLTVTSMLQHSSVPLTIQIIGDPASQEIARGILKDAAAGTKSTYIMISLDVDRLAKKVDEIVRPMQDHFSYKPGAYYNHALFFLSIAMHKVMPQTLRKVIMLDSDLKFRADIKELYNHFDLFTDMNIMGIGRDMQPVYRHTFWSYRNKNKGTRVGEPPPNGLTGFNSGVLLLDLDRMRQSKLYNSLLNREAVQNLTKEYDFKGHLGDQDFFTLLSMKYEGLFHVLPCNWNRQLCQWWKNKGYESVFDLYYSCEGEVKIYHGNCNTPIPED